MVSAGPIPGGHDEQAGLYAICSNITGRRKAEEKVRDIADDLERRVVERTGELAMSNRLLEEALRSREEFLAASEVAIGLGAFVVPSAWLTRISSGPLSPSDVHTATLPALSSGVIGAREAASPSTWPP